MNILLLCNKSPWPPKEGGPIAMNAMVTGLMQAGHLVKVLAINSNKYNIPEDSIPTEYRRSTRFETVYIDLSVKPWPAFLNLFTGRSYHVERFISEDFSSTLISVLKTEKFDIIQFETLFTTPYLPLIKKYSSARLVLRAHNIEHLIWKRVASKSRNPLKRLYLTHLWKTLRKYEFETLNQVDGIVAITGKDAESFRKMAPHTPVTGIPFGIDTGKAVTVIAAARPPATLFHIGAMNWIPNQEGIRWFLQKVWPVLVKKYPDLTFHLAGREMPAWLKNLKMKGVVVDGEVPDAARYMENHSIMVVPLFSGSGIRIKIVEGMLAGKAIVTTAIGAEGIDCSNGDNILIAGDRDAFVEEIGLLLENPSLIPEIGSRAQKTVIRNHDNRQLMRKISDFYRDILH